MYIHGLKGGKDVLALTWEGVALLSSTTSINEFPNSYHQGRLLVVERNKGNYGVGTIGKTQNYVNYVNLLCKSK